MGYTRSFRSSISWPGFRRLLQTLHLWAGLILAIPFILIGISGSILILQPEIPRLDMPYATTPGEMQSLDRILAAGRAVVPEGMRITRMSLPQRWGEPVSLRYGPGGRGGGNYGGRNVFVDPVSLEILGQAEQRRPHAIFGIMRTLHATLYVRTISDRTFIGWLGIAMVLLSLTGLVLWWPRKGGWKRAFLVRRGATGFRLNRDLHAAFGIWTLLLFLVVGISGVYLAFPRPFRAAVGAVLPLGYNFSDGTEALSSPGAQPLSLDEAVALARQVVPRAEPISFQLPARPSDVMIINFLPNGYGMGAPTPLVSLDPAARQIVYVDDPRVYASGERFIAWQRLLHSGLGLGIAYKVLVFLSGLLPLLFAITGVRMWWLKRAQRRYTVVDAVPEVAE